MRILVALLAGITFGAGLALADMTNPAKVQNFLDFFGSWDPSLAFVMGGAVVIYALADRLRGQRSASARSGIDLSLILGAALFGLGWGLAGFCPGPAIASLVSGSLEVAIFVAAMISGMLLFALYDRGRREDSARRA